MAKKTSSRSPTERSLAWMEQRGYRCDVTEHWNAHARIRVDLFGVIDIMAVQVRSLLVPHIVLVQCTSVGGFLERVKKAKELLWHAREPTEEQKAQRKRPWKKPPPKPNWIGFIVRVPGVIMEVHGWRPGKTGLRFARVTSTICDACNGVGLQRLDSGGWGDNCATCLGQRVLIHANETEQSLRDVRSEDYGATLSCMRGEEALTP